MHRLIRSATTAAVTTPTGPIATNEAPQADGGYDAVRGNDTIQYTPIETPEPVQPPSWLKDVEEFLSNVFTPVAELFGASWPVFKWVLIAGAALLLLYILWKLLAPILDLRANQSPEIEEEWVPQQSDAIALLEDADRLAAEGQYDAATHLLLQRSVGQIASARPEWVEPASTARELAALPALPEAARIAFGTIASRVENSIFALKTLGKDDWQAARSAYADFALQSLRGKTR